MGAVDGDTDQTQQAEVILLKQVMSKYGFTVFLFFLCIYLKFSITKLVGFCLFVCFV
jgi:hypothetical protein